MIEAQGMIPEREGFHGEWPDASLPQDLVAEIGTKGQVLNPVWPVAKQSSNVAGFEQKSPNQVTNHKRPD